MGQTSLDYRGWRSYFEEVEEILFGESIEQASFYLDSLERMVKGKEDSYEVDQYHLEYLKNLYYWRSNQRKKISVQRLEFLLSLMSDTHREQLLKAKFLFLEAMHQWQKGEPHSVVSTTLTSSLGYLFELSNREAQLLKAKILESQSDASVEYGLYEYAFQPLKEALEIYLVFFSDHYEFLGNVYSKLARVYEANGMQRNAYTSFVTAIQYFERNEVEIDSSQRFTYEGYWNVLLVLGFHSELENSLEIYEKRKRGISLDMTEEGVLYYYSAVLSIRKGDFKSSSLHYERMVAHFEKAPTAIKSFLISLRLGYLNELWDFDSNSLDPSLLEDLSKDMDLFCEKEEFAVEWEKFYSLLLRYYLEQKLDHKVEELLVDYHSILSHLQFNRNYFLARFYTFQAKHNFELQNFGKAKSLYSKAFDQWVGHLPKDILLYLVEDKELLLEIYCSLAEIALKMVIDGGNESQLNEAEKTISQCFGWLLEYSVQSISPKESLSLLSFARRVGELLFEMEELKVVANYEELQKYLYFYNGTLRKVRISKPIKAFLKDSISIYQQVLLRNDVDTDKDGIMEKMRAVIKEIKEGEEEQIAISYEEIASLLPANTDLLQYFWGVRKIFILQTQSSSFRLYGIRKSLDCDSIGKEWIALLKQKEIPSKFSDWANPLYKQLFFPLKHVSENLFVIPDGLLLEFPLETLMEEESKEGVFPFLVHKYKIRYLSNLGQLWENKRSSFFQSSFLGIYNGSEELIKLIGGIFPVSKVLQGKSIHYQRFFSLMKEYNVVHITKEYARKFRFGTDKTSNLTKAGAKIDVMVVEDTWEEENSNYGLNNANAFHFIHALWEGDFLSNKLLFLTFYKRIALGQEIGNSLRESQLALIEVHSLDKPYAWPYYWANYRLYGLPGQLPPLRQDPWRSALPAGIIFALLLTILVFFRYGNKSS